MVEAANQYTDNPTAFQLRWLNILYEIGLEGKGTLMMVPMNTPAAGLAPMTNMGIADSLKKTSGNTDSS